MGRAEFYGFTNVGVCSLAPLVSVPAEVRQGSPGRHRPPRQADGQSSCHGGRGRRGCGRTLPDTEEQALMGQLESWNGWKGPRRPPGLSLKPTGGWVLRPSPGLRRGLAGRAEHEGAAEALSAPHTGPSARADAVVEVPSPTQCQKSRFTALDAILPDCSSEENPLSLGENPFSALIPGAQHLDPTPSDSSQQVEPKAGL